MRKFLIFALIIFSGLNLFAQNKKLGENAVSNKSAAKVSLSIAVEEYAVYLAIIGEKVKTFVVRDTTAAADSGEREDASLTATFKKMTPETLEDFRAKNKESSTLEKKFPTQIDYTLLSAQELKQFFEKSLDWGGFYKKYPDSGGFWSFSRVGFSKDGAQAFVYGAHNCGGLCGEGKYYFLQKEDGKWKVIEEDMLWIS